MNAFKRASLSCQQQLRRGPRHITLTLLDTPPRDCEEEAVLVEKEDELWKPGPPKPEKEEELSKPPGPPNPKLIPERMPPPISPISCRIRLQCARKDTLSCH